MINMGCKGVKVLLLPSIVDDSFLACLDMRVVSLEEKIGMF